jgi:DNA topoisomerase VI subunit B
MASVWVPFTSESKEAIADYDEIRKEITLALREAGRRLGMFLKRRARAHDEYKRRNVFELYIDEVVGACSRLKGGKIAEAKLKAQMLEIAKKLTGGEKTDALVDKNAGPQGLPHSIIVTASGIEGEVPTSEPPPAVVAEAVKEAEAADEARPPVEPKARPTIPASKAKKPPVRKSKAAAKPKKKSKGKGKK